MARLDNLDDLTGEPARGERPVAHRRADRLPDDPVVRLIVSYRCTLRGVTLGRRAEGSELNLAWSMSKVVR
jgi:hypothetical protein